MKLKSCPFCNHDEVKLYSDHHPVRMWRAVITCQHCAATGSDCGGAETQADAEESAIQNWNEAGRPGWWHKNVSRRWNTFCYDIHMILSGGYDLRAYLKNIWK